MRPLVPLSPTLYLPPQDRLLLGKPLTAALDTAEPDAWVDLDRRIATATAWRTGVRPLRYLLRERYADGNGSVDWAAAPRWDEEAHDVTWSRFPPSEAETALVLCHDRWQAREAALALTPGRPPSCPCCWCAAPTPGRGCASGPAACWRRTWTGPRRRSWCPWPCG